VSAVPNAVIVRIPILLAAWSVGLAPTNFHAGNVKVLKVASVVILIVLDLPIALLDVVNVVFADIEIV
jgi:hypothetical protein